MSSEFCLLKAYFFFSINPTSWIVQSKVFYNKAFSLHGSDPCSSGSSEVEWFIRGWGNPFQLAHMKSILSMKNGNLWKTAADSNSDLFGKRWVMFTLKPLGGREWGSPVDSYHSWFPLGNRTDCQSASPEYTGVRDTQCMAHLLVEVGVFQ